MKDTIKSSIVGGLAIFGLVALISSSNTAPTVIHEGSNIPESHVWTLSGWDNDFFMWNKATGEVRKLNGNSFDGGGGQMFKYKTMTDLK